MALITGFSCDSCGKVANRSGTSGPPQLPEKWMTLTPVAANGVESRDAFHLCSNRCLVRLGRERLKAAVERGDEPATRPSGQEIKKRREAANKGVAA